MNFSQVLQDIKDAEVKTYPFDSKKHSNEVVMEILARLGIEWEDVPIHVAADCIKYIEGALDHERCIGYENGLEDSCGRSYH